MFIKSQYTVSGVGSGIGISGGSVLAKLKVYFTMGNVLSGKLSHMLTDLVVSPSIGYIT